MTRDEMEQGKKIKKKRYYDYTLLILVVMLTCFGLVMVYSVSYYNANKYYSDPTKFLMQQARAAVLGVVVMFAVSKIDYHLYIKKTKFTPMKLVFLGYIICLAMQVYVGVLGRVNNGSQRWIEIGPINFQPSEVTKILVLIFTAYLVKLAPSRLDKIWGFLRIFIIMSPLLLLVAYENLSTGIITVAIFVSICFVASSNKKYYILGFLGLLLVAVVLILCFPYRRERFVIWQNIETNPKGYQILQGLYAIASGGLFGKGLGQSVQKLGFIPEAHNDMIFSVICEELGIVGAFVVLLVFVFLIYRIFQIAVNAPDLFGSLIATGVMTHIAVQVIINICVVTNTIPSTGIPLPFISYGGTSLLILLAEMGLVLSVSNRIEGER